jgi:hypothetical protein
MKKLAYRVRTNYYLNTNPNHEQTKYIPHLYIKLKGWTPPPTSPNTEDRLELFEKHITEAFTQKYNIKPPFSSLTPQQKETLNLLKNNKDLIILPTDKNLAPAMKHLLTSS